MSSLKFAEKRHLEDFLGMGSGYVLNFSDRTFQEFVFDAVNVDIYGGDYDGNGSSKAKHLRCFWEKEEDERTGRLLKALVEYGLELAEARDEDLTDQISYKKSWLAVQRLLGNRGQNDNQEITEEDFLKQIFKDIRFEKLPIESSLIPVIEQRFQETEKCFNAGANLSAVILSGSILEAVLLGLSQANPKLFNKAASAPKTRQGNAKTFDQWKLAEFVAVAHEVKALRQDVRKFSDHLRDFRNYIHPFQQMASGFTPDNHTAEICLAVLKAAICQIIEWGDSNEY
ncbi:hypothetical protein [Magnetospira sp. QH-2]|uniref:hypothetical protein n=1 Tax=Magnetospira sp. (strain QH-2) TaxID=1288970 RepID=UPI0003E81833|nr:hypothetical protein [Magnetospira sp. QH-2]CCQ74233.1 Conserved protein of unknown function [Magnetospira sp. QH-2]